MLNERDGLPVRRNDNELAASPFLLVGDHAGLAIPEALTDLGLSQTDRSRHIALDLGVRELGLVLGEKLGAPFVWQHFSRLVCDCNRHPSDPDWAAATSDGSEIPGNRDISNFDRAVRLAQIFEPYHRAIAEALDVRNEAGATTVLVSLHSFTPTMDGVRRPWEIGVLHDGRDDAFALRVLELLRRCDGFMVGDNEPYDMDHTDYTVPRHAYPRGLPYIEIEVRQDLLADGAGVERIADLLAEILPAALH